MSLRDRALGGAVNAVRELISQRWLGDDWSLENLRMESDDQGKSIRVRLRGPDAIGPVAVTFHGCRVDDDGRRLVWSEIVVDRVGLSLDAVEGEVEWVRLGPGNARPEDGIPRALRWALR